MNKLTIFLVTTLASTASLFSAEELETSLSTLKFANGDQLSGELVEMKASSISIDCPYFIESSTSFISKSVLSILLPDAKLSDSETIKTHLATLTLSDRVGNLKQYEKIQGEIIKMSEDSVTVLTDFAGTIEIDSSLILSISIGSVSKTLYRGPVSIDEWHSFNSSKVWSVKNNKLISSHSNSSIAKDLNIPDKAILSFDLKCEQSSNFKAQLYSDKIESSRPTHFYEFKVRNEKISMSRYGGEVRNNILQETRISQERFRDDQNSFTIYMDKPKGVFHIFLNESYVNTFTNPTPNANTLGTSLHLSNDSGHALEFSNIHLSKWSGPAPIPGDPKSAELLTGEGQTIHLANGDMMRGTLGDISNGAIAIETPHGTFQVPLAGVSLLKQLDELGNQSKEDANDVKAHFHNGNWIIIDVDHIDGTHIHGNNEAFGDCKFALSSFKKIDFNIYSYKLNELRQKLESK